MKLVLCLKSLFVYSAIIQIVKEARVVDGRKTGSNVRKFFIAAVEQEWDYAPSGKNQAKGIDLEQDRLVRIKIFVFSPQTQICYEHIDHTWCILMQRSFKNRSPKARSLALGLNHLKLSMVYSKSINFQREQSLLLTCSLRKNRKGMITT